jgi:hypothetical protein
LRIGVKDKPVLTKRNVALIAYIHHKRPISAHSG